MQNKSKAAVFSLKYEISKFHNVELDMSADRKVKASLLGVILFINLKEVLKLRKFVTKVIALLQLLIK